MTKNVKIPPKSIINLTQSINCWENIICKSLFQKRILAPNCRWYVDFSRKCQQKSNVTSLGLLFDRTKITIFSTFKELKITTGCVWGFLLFSLTMKNFRGIKIEYTLKWNSWQFWFKMIIKLNVKPSVHVYQINNVMFSTNLNTSELYRFE